MKKVFLMVVAFAAMVLAGCSEAPLLSKVNITYISEGMIAFEQEVDGGKFFLPEQKLSKENYAFGGWYLDSEFIYPMAFNSGSQSDLTLYAKWIENDTEISDEYLTEWLTNNAELINSLVDLQGLSASEILHLVDQGQQQMIASVNRSVVMIDIVGGPWEGSGGSGVIYQKIDNTYYVLTNHHVTEGTISSNFRITVFNGSTKKMYSGVTKVHELLGKELAILKFTTTDQLPVITMANGSDIKKGQFVYAVGSPVWFEDIVTQGVISYAKLNDYTEDGFDAWVIMHTAPINPGNSGGALINAYGQLVGINAYSYPMYDEETDLQLYNFAIHIDEVKTYINGKV
ncbi:trypsin-like peptidase domain-containing protein [Acholeplasma equirhinis]|uniref:trypsin-like peptidase domain-containing protein n=1 Tax=Acholeplasma equirhinis TaxID=555393 RepID=UPI00197A7DAA|nr:trypsin-like peptidase domain-containing protein [Acholeplasma equirhinis]MBN3491202.1 trypsin-like peptidase domain-containing protein [Acholeplasma equirhinis]